MNMSMRMEMRLDQHRRMPDDTVRQPLLAECAGCGVWHQLVRWVSEAAPDAHVYLQPTHECAGLLAEAPHNVAN
jgi:hypothetical protein